MRAGPLRRREQKSPQNAGFSAYLCTSRLETVTDTYVPTAREVSRVQFPHNASRTRREGQARRAAGSGRVRIAERGQSAVGTGTGDFRTHLCTCYHPAF